MRRAVAASPPGACRRPAAGRDHRAGRGQHGAVLLIMLGALLLVSAAILLGHLNAAVRTAPARDPDTRDTLARAKAALIAWAATHPDTPGLLPFPDRNDEATPAYDGTSDCEPAATIAPAHLLGRFPVLGEEAGTDGCTADIPMAMELDDSSGERLWYAVSQNLVRGGNVGPVNPDIGDLALNPWLTVRDAAGAIVSTRVAAVIIAPGPALGAQNRTAVAPAAGNYLDSLVVGANTYDNSDSDDCWDVACGGAGEEFIIADNPQADALFNDRVVYITVDELMRAVEDRVLGDVARVLRGYRNAAAPPNDYYPWMSPFSTPRPVQGVATGGSATSLVDAGTVFTGLVNDGDLVRNVTDGSIGRVAAGGVAANTLTLEALVGGAGNVFASGDRYVVHDLDKFKGLAGEVEGLLPLHYPNEMFRTGFTVNWNFDDEDQTTGGDPGLQPGSQTPEEFDGNPLTVDYPNGLCMWTQNDRVDCMGTAFLPGAGTAGSDRTVQVWFNFTADTTTIVPPSATLPRTRNHTLNANTPYTDPIGPIPMLVPAGQDFSVRVIDDDGTPGACAPLGTATNCGWRTAVPDFDTDLTITQFDGIRYEIAVPDELPAWFVDNDWHQFVLAAASGANLPATAGTSGDGTCTVPPAVPPFVPADEPDYCLTIEYNGVRVRGDVEALVMGAGNGLAAVPQDRVAGTACPASQPNFLCDYFEIPNSRDFAPDLIGRNIVFGRAPASTFEISASFNDQIRAVPPP